MEEANKREFRIALCVDFAVITIGRENKASAHDYYHLLRIMLEKARRLLGGRSLGDMVTLGVHPSQVSVMVGQHRENVIALKEEFLIKNIKICAKNVKKDTIEIS